MDLILENKKHKLIWKEVVKRLKGIGKKDYVLHSKMVVRAMQDILRCENEDPGIMIPAAMLHDIGWSKVSDQIVNLKTDSEKKEAEISHIELAADLISEILGCLEYKQSEIEEITRVVQSHKSKAPGCDKRIKLIIDSDNLSDTYRESFYSDVKSYNTTPQKNFDFRSKNKFFTSTAKEISKRNMAERLREINNGKAQRLLQEYS
jgi:L-rhamnose mutarotase